MVKNIIFDMGRVLIDWNPPRMVARLGYTGDDAALLLREVFSGAEWAGLDRGLEPDDMLARILPRLPAHLHGAAEHFVYAWWVEELWPIQGMAELIRECKALGLHIYLLSNATSCLHRYFDRIPGSECFEGRLVSADCKLMKPEHEIYELLFERFSLSPEDCFFIDDNPANIEAAERLGLRGAVFFQDVARLRRELRAAGIPVREEA